MLDVRRLAILVTASRTGSLSAAAAELGITPSAASQAVSALEAGVGRPLLVRHGRGVHATEAGERLVVRGQAVLADLQAADDEARGTRGGEVVLAAPPTVVAALVPAVLDRLRRSDPGTVVQVVESDRAATVEKVQTGSVDVGIVDHHVHDPAAIGPLLPVVLRDEPFVVWLPAGHPAAGTAAVHLGDLRNDGWIVAPPLSTCAALLAWAWAGAGLSPRVVATCAEYRTTASLVAAGVGVALVPALATSAASGLEVTCRPTATPLQRRLTAVVRPAARPPAVRAVLGALAAAATGTRP